MNNQAHSGRARVGVLILTFSGLGALGIGFLLPGLIPRANRDEGTELSACVRARPCSPQAGSPEPRSAKRPEPHIRRQRPAEPLDPAEQGAYERLIGEIGKPAPNRERLGEWADWQVRRIQEHLAAYPRSTRAIELYHWILVNQIDVLGRFAEAERTLVRLESLIETGNRETTASARTRALRLRVRLYALWKKPDREQAAIQRLLPEAGRTEQRLLKGRLYELSRLVPGRVLPAAGGTDLNGEPITPKTWHGKVLCLTFWDLGDRSVERDFRCRMQARSAFRDQGLVLLGVPLSRSRPAVEAFVRRLAVDWPQLWDDRYPGNDHPLARRFTPTGRPTSFLVDRNGVIRHRDLHGRELLLRTEELLRQAARSAD